MQYTEDSIWRSNIHILQPAKGYRFALDAVLLAHFVKTAPSETILEIGAGSGVVSVLVAALNIFHSAIAVEIQSELAHLCKKNFEVNKVHNAIVYEADIKNIAELSPHSLDLIYSNPPYRITGSGRLNPSSQKAIARHEIKMTLKDVFDCAERYLKPSGRLSVILPEFRESDFHALLQKCGFHKQEWRYVHSFADQSPVFFLATIGKTDQPFFQYPRLIIYEKPGVYTAEMNKLLGSKGR